MRKPLKLEPERGRGNLLQIRLTGLEKDGFQRAAHLSGLALSAWVRERLRQAAKVELEDAGQEIPFLPVRG
jgi:hypothetical protein